MAVIQNNEGFLFEFNLCKRLRLPELSFQNKEIISKNQSDITAKPALRKTVAYHQEVNSYRGEIRFDRIFNRILQNLKRINLVGRFYSR